MIVQTDAANEIYVDDFKVTYLSAGTSTLDEINFGFTGETFPELKVFDEAVDGLPETDNGEEENPEETAPTVWDGTVAESFAGGSGTEADPYLIATAEQLALAITQSGTTKQTNAETGEEETVNETYFGSYYKLTKDILLNDPNAIDWKNATEAQEGLRTWYDYQENFAGHIDGDGHVVYGLYHYTKGTIDSSIAYATYGKKGAGLIPLVNTDDTVKEITWYGKDLRAIIKAYQFKTAYTNEELGISVDFSDTKGEILSYQFGHIHKQKSLYSADVDLWQIYTGSAQVRDGFFDIMTVDSTSINRYAIGRGYDERFVQTKNTLIGDLTGDEIVDICDAVKLRNIDALGETITTRADVNKDSAFVLADDLAALISMLIS